MMLRVSAFLLALFVPAAALAQDERGATVGGTIAAMNMESSTDLSFSGTFGYQFSRVVGLEIEATAVPDLTSEPFPIAVILIYPGPRIENQDGRAIIFSTNVRAHIPTTTTRLDPYFVAGGGVASLRRTADLVYSGISPVATGTVGMPVLRVPFTQPIRESTTDMALTLGGGIGVRVARRLFVDADLRMFRLLGQEDRNAGRFGVGVRYRF
jgi:opacity protein-like surface antigen